MSAPFDLLSQAVLTDVIVRPKTTQYEDNPMLGGVIAPLKSIPARHAKFNTRQVLAFGKGQFRAPDATPALYKGQHTWRQEMISLVLLEEVERIKEEDYLALNSPDENVRRAAGLDLTERGGILTVRNERLTEWMRWQAFSGSITIPYPGGDSLFIDYGFQAWQKPTASTLWSDLTNSDPIQDMRDISDTMASKTGYFAQRYHMGSDTWALVQRNAKLRALLTGNDRPMMIPGSADVMQLLNDGTEIVIYDNGFRDDNQGTNRGLPDSLTRYLPKGKVLVTTDYSIEGQNIAETLDGQVVVNGGNNSLKIVQGSTGETVVEPLSHNMYMRVASARIPRLIYPDCFVWMTVS